MLTRDYLLEAITYNLLTGDMHWLNRPRHHFVSEHQMNAWNARWSGEACGSIGNHGYIGIHLNYKLHLAHRLAWLYVTGELPTGYIGHINHTRTDNKWVNLRSVEKVENHKNISLSSANTSGATGLSWDKERSKWLVHITLNKRLKYLGRFACYDDAVAERKRAEKQYGFHANHGVAHG